jgi:hypothetical protein
MNSSEIVPVLRKHPEIVQDWMLYSADKRTDGGWYVNPDKLEAGEHRNASSTRRLDSLEVTIAAYVLEELDFWARPKTGARR